MYYLRDGLKSPFLAWLYALVAGVAALTTTPFTQPNSIALVLNSVFGIPKWAAGIAIAVLTWAVIIGGIKSIGRAAEKLAPLKGTLYLLGGSRADLQRPSCFGSSVWPSRHASLRP